MPSLLTDTSTSGQMNITGAMYTLAPQVTTVALLGSFVLCGELAPAGLADSLPTGFEQLALELPAPTDVSDFLDFNHQLLASGTVGIHPVAGSLPSQDWDY